MARNKAARAPGKHHGSKAKATRKMRPSTAKLSAKGNEKGSTSHATTSVGGSNLGSKKNKQQQRRPIIPFSPSDRILLVGEGDFSFSASLATHHGCHRILATCYDSEETLHQKYPRAKKNIEQLHDAISAGGRGGGGGAKRKREDDDDDDPDDNEGMSGKEEPGSDGGAHEQKEKRGDEKSWNEFAFPRVLYSVDARKLGATGGGGKLIRRGMPRASSTSKPWKNRKSTESSVNAARRGSASGQAGETTPDSGPWDIIAFNFPHVGGLSTDVNRQVRANQELLVSFFKACVPLLSAPPSPAELGGSSDDESDDEETGGDYEEDDSSDNAGGERKKGAKHRRRTEPGQVIVTLFEGEPYTLWNIRDLARHAGLRVVTSFKFPWSSYPGYSHARTLGEIESKHGGRGGWRGEDREARTYVFERKDHESPSQKAGQKRRRESDDDSDDE
ncbi:hypothetical protein VTO42DRAFT_6365 [Malbranchea cinnamomea]